MGTITAVAATATSSRATHGEAAAARDVGCDPCRDESSVVTLERIVFVLLEIAACHSWIQMRTATEYRIGRDQCYWCRFDHGRPLRLQPAAHSDSYQSMRASGALANTLPQRVEFFGIARRRSSP
jgi:hypothetical protein